MVIIMFKFDDAKIGSFVGISKYQARYLFNNSKFIVDGC